MTRSEEHELIKNAFETTQNGIQNILNNESLIDEIEKVSKEIIKTIEKKSLIFSCGNGGSMCDAMHFAEELTARYRKTRNALPAISISDPAFISCVANDFGFDYVFSRFLEANAKAGDVLFAISTSGKSKNIIEAAKLAKESKITLISLTGNSKTELAKMSDFNINTPCGEYADRIQELHSIVIHIIIELIEKSIFYSK